MKRQFEEKFKIRAVHDADLEPLLQKLGLLEDIENGNLRCSFCGRVLTFDNFGGVYKENDQLKSFCQETKCYLEMLKRKSDVK